MMELGYESLVNIPGVGAGLADAFFEKGIYSAEELAESSVEELVEIRGIGQEKAPVLLENARQYVIEAAEAAERERLEEEARAAEEAERAEAGDEEPQAEPGFNPKGLQPEALSKGKLTDGCGCLFTVGWPASIPARDRNIKIGISSCSQFQELKA